jgi:hypothetical protein
MGHTDLTNPVFQSLMGTYTKCLNLFNIDVSGTSLNSGHILPNQHREHPSFGVEDGVFVR